MHEYSKRIGEHIKSCYSDFNKMNIQELQELEKWACIMKDLTEYDINKRMIETFDEQKKDDELMEKIGMGSMGYRGRDSRGRFVHRPGRGRSAGYTSFIPRIMGDEYEDDYMEYPEMYGNYRMGYSVGRNQNSSKGNSGENYKSESNSPYSVDNGNSIGGYGYSENYRIGSKRGETYDRYRDNRRHYTDTKDEESKKKMEESMKEYMDDAIDSMKEMWKDADPQLRQTMKSDLTKMVQQLQ